MVTRDPVLGWGGRTAGLAMTATFWWVNGIYAINMQ